MKKARKIGKKKRKKMKTGTDLFKELEFVKNKPDTELKAKSYVSDFTFSWSKGRLQAKQ